MVCISDIPDENSPSAAWTNAISLVKITPERGVANAHAEFQYGV